MNTKVSEIEKILADINSPEEWDEVLLIVKKMHNNKKNNFKLDAKKDFKVGDIVVFTSTHKRSTGRHVGILRKKNPKKCIVEICVGTIHGQWHVPYSYLRAPTEEDKLNLSIARLKGK